MTSTKSHALNNDNLFARSKSTATAADEGKMIIAQPLCTCKLFLFWIYSCFYLWIQRCISIFSRMDVFFHIIYRKSIADIKRKTSFVTDHANEVNIWIEYLFNNCLNIHLKHKIVVYYVDRFQASVGTGSSFRVGHMLTKLTNYLSLINNLLSMLIIS